MYGLLIGWIALLAGVVIFVATDDPTQGHAGRLVYTDEEALKEANKAGRAFRIFKDDRVVKMEEATGSGTQRAAWIRITSGPHAGRSGIVVW